jgi:hypothetical protein
MIPAGVSGLFGAGFFVPGGSLYNLSLAGVQLVLSLGWPEERVHRRHITTA